MYIVKPSSTYVQVLNERGTPLTRIDVSGYKGVQQAYLSDDKVIIACGDGRTRVYKTSGTLIESY